MTTDRPASYKGLFPVAPTPFHDNGDIDLEGQRRVLDCMIDQGSMASACLPTIPNSSC